ncbi:MAG: alanine racemase [Alphaproteobacteria bacterium]|nr:alanine racemase [Alphaproteobacteria bacterium SS10]
MDSATFQTSGSNSLLRIDLDAIARNYQALQQRSGSAMCAGVVKANAYGLGIEEVANRLWAAGCRFFFVATLDEAIELRSHLDDAQIAVLSCYTQGSEVEMITHRIIPVLNDPGDLHRWRSASRAAARKLPAILHVDTGMSRLGLTPDQFDEVAEDPEALKGFDLRFVMSHLASADVEETEQNQQQLSAFRSVMEKLPETRASFANSAGIFRGAEYIFDLTRPGMALYGLNPTPWTDNPMTPVVRLSARILQVRDIPAGTPVGYGASWVAERDSKIATLGLGYADGFIRQGGNSGHVPFGDLKAPIVGRISMDLTGVDVTDIPFDACRTGDYVEIIGPHRSVDDVATDHGTIGYEILTSLGNRYKRVYEGATTS